MISKELRGIWWKVVVAATSMLPAVLIVAAYLPPYETSGRAVERLSDEAALGQILNVYGGGGVALALLAILLGASTMSEETSRGTIFLLLSKPAGRSRILLTKYAISAGILLAAAVLGHAMLIVAAGFRSYPIGLLSAQGVVLSTALIWLGSLSVLGLATTISILLRNVLASAAVNVVALYLILYPLPGFVAWLASYGTMETLAPPYSWTSVQLYAGEGSALLQFLSCATVAALLLLAPLWLFQRKAF